MSEKKKLITRIVARVTCLLPKDWLGRAGRRFRQTTTVVSDYAHEHIRTGERLEQAPDLIWKAAEGAAHEKYAKALKDYAEEEKERVDTELKRRTMDSKARQETAAAAKMESEARTAQIKELDARIDLFDKLKRCGAVPVWNENGNMTVSKVPADFNWDALQDLFLRTGELPKLEGPSKERGKQLQDETGL